MRCSVLELLNLKDADNVQEDINSAKEVTVPDSSSITTDDSPSPEYIASPCAYFLKTAKDSASFQTALH